MRCEFQMDDFNLFDNPVVWRKRQHSEETSINLMGNLQDPFVFTKRFKVRFVSQSPRHIFELAVEEIRLEDSGNYTCEIHGPQNTLIGNVTHSICVEADVLLLRLTNTDVTLDDGSFSQDNRSSPPPSRGTSQQQKQQRQQPLLRQRPLRNSLIYVLDRPATLRCIVVAEAQFEVRIFLGRRDITASFDREQTVTVGGVTGLRVLRYTVQLINRRFQPGEEGNGKKIKCSVYSPGGAVNSTSLRLIAHFAPRIQCETNSASVGDKNVTLRCEVSYRPPISSVYWVINNYTTISGDEEIVSNYVVQNRDLGVLETQLIINEARPDSYRTYAVVAENAVGRRIEHTILQQNPRGQTSPNGSSATKMNLKLKGPGLRNLVHPSSSVANRTNRLPVALLLLIWLVVALVTGARPAA